LPGHQTRCTEAPVEKNLIRDEIKQPNVVYSGMVDGNMGYIKLNKFFENSADEVTSAHLQL
jgi:carboxyl-terminal processing protease